jgi:hypothetical protein
MLPEHLEYVICVHSMALGALLHGLEHTFLLHKQFILHCAFALLGIEHGAGACLGVEVPVIVLFSLTFLLLLVVELVFEAHLHEALGNCYVGADA